MAWSVGAFLAVTWIDFPTGEATEAWLGAWEQYDGSSGGLDVLTRRFSMTVLRGDVNGDGLVSGPDLDIILAEWGNQGAKIFNPLADISGDGLVSGPDLDIVLAQWGNTGYQP